MVQNLGRTHFVAAAYVARALARFAIRTRALDILEHAHQTLVHIVAHERRPDGYFAELTVPLKLELVLIILWVEMILVNAVGRRYILFRENTHNQLLSCLVFV